MPSGVFRFEPFCLDPANRRLTREGAAVEISARYLDALVLLVREAGRLVSKDRFHDDIWHGVPVTDEALTQCIRTLRRQLGDDAARPRFIETVPKHGYRFVAPVEWVEEARGGAAAAATEPAPVPAAGLGSSCTEVLLLGGAGTLGGGVAGILVGLFYGLGGASQPLGAGMGAVSVLLVLVAINILAGLVAAAGVAFGIAAGRRLGGGWTWGIAGGAAGGLIVGAIVKLLSLDAFTLLFGQAPVDITGAAEGVLLGAAVGLAAWFANREGRPSLRRGAAAGALAGGAAGLLVALAGGRLMGGSLDLLARHFPNSRLRLDEIAALLGESGFGPVSRAATGTLEAMAFGGCVVAAMMLALRALPRRG